MTSAVENALKQAGDKPGHVTKPTQHQAIVPIAVPSDFAAKEEAFEKAERNDLKDSYKDAASESAINVHATREARSQGHLSATMNTVHNQVKNQDSIVPEI